MTFRGTAGRVAAVLLLAATARGQDEIVPGFAPPRQPRASAPAVSALRRFNVSGMASADNISLSVSADDASRRIENMVGLSLPFQRHEIVRVVVEDDPAIDGWRVIKAQGWADRQIAQKLIVLNMGRADQEDVLEGLCWLLLNRLVVARQDIPQRYARLGEVPDWLAVGFAQNLYPALRARNSEAITRAWLEGRGISMAEVLELEHMPEGRWGEKAAAGLAVGWLLSRPNAQQLFDTMFRRIADGAVITPAALAEPGLLGLSPVELEKHWDLWIAQQTQVIRRWGGVSPQRLDALEDALVVRPIELGFPEDRKIPETLTMEQLVDRRREAWMPMLATTLALQIRGLGIGEGPELRRVLDAYGQYLDALVRAAKPGWFARMTFRVPSERKLRRLLADADAARESFKTGGAGDAAGAGPAAADVAEVGRFMPREERLRHVEEMRRAANP